MDSERASLELTRNDWMFAAILVAFENPDLVRDAAKSLNEMLPGPRTHPQADQLRFADGDNTAREVLAKPA